MISVQRWIRVVAMLMAFAPELLLAQDPSIVAPGAKLERLFGDGFFTEGPAQAPDGSVYFSDIKSVIVAGLFNGRPLNSSNDLVLYQIRVERSGYHSGP